MKKSLTIITLAISTFLAINACSKKESDPAPAVGSSPSTAVSTYYFHGTFDNATYNLESASSVNGIQNGIVGGSVGNYVDYANSDDYVYEFWEGSLWSNFLFQNGQYNEDDKLVIKVHKSFNYIGMDSPSEQDIRNLYSAGNYTNFSIASSDPDMVTTQGWDIELIDDNGQSWTSYNGTAVQTGSFIKIDSQKDDVINGDQFLSAKGSLSCKLYDGNGNVKVLTGNFNQLFTSFSTNW